MTKDAINERFLSMIRRTPKGDRGSTLPPRNSDRIRNKLIAGRQRRKRNGKKTYNNDEERPVQTPVMQSASSQSN